MKKVYKITIYAEDYLIDGIQLEEKEIRDKLIDVLKKISAKNDLVYFFNDIEFYCDEEIEDAKDN